MIEAIDIHYGVATVQGHRHEAMRAGWGSTAAALVSGALALSVLPILFRVLPPLTRDIETQKRDPHFWVTVLALVLYCAIVAIVVLIRELRELLATSPIASTTCSSDFSHQPPPSKPTPPPEPPCCRLQQLAEPVRRHRKLRNTFAPKRSGCVR